MYLQLDQVVGLNPLESFSSTKLPLKFSGRDGSQRGAHPQAAIKHPLSSSYGGANKSGEVKQSSKEHCFKIPALLPGL